MSEQPIRIDGRDSAAADSLSDQDRMFAPPSAAELEGTTAFDLLRATLSKQVAKPAVTLPVLLRDGVSVEFDANIDNELLTAWRRRAQYDDARLGTDPLKLAVAVIANKAIQFRMNGRVVTAQGRPLTFADEEVWQMVGAASPSDAIRKFYGADAHVIITGEEILRAAGYGDSITQQDTDPTAVPLRS